MKNEPAATRHKVYPAAAGQPSLIFFSLDPMRGFTMSWPKLVGAILGLESFGLMLWQLQWWWWRAYVTHGHVMGVEIFWLAVAVVLCVLTFPAFWRNKDHFVSIRGTTTNIHQSLYGLKAAPQSTYVLSARRPSAQRWNGTARPRCGSKRIDTRSTGLVYD